MTLEQKLRLRFSFVCSAEWKWGENDVFLSPFLSPTLSLLFSLYSYSLLSFFLSLFLLLSFSWRSKRKRKQKSTELSSSKQNNFLREKKKERKKERREKKKVRVGGSGNEIVPVVIKKTKEVQTKCVSSLEQKKLIFSLLLWVSFFLSFSHSSLSLIVSLSIGW